MTKKISIQVVRKEPLDAEKLAAALVEIAVRIVKPPAEPPSKSEAK